MILNKQIELIGQFTGDYNREIHGRMLVGKVKMSQKAIALALSSLEKGGILKSRKQGTLRLFSLNTKYTGMKDTLLITETEKKLNFMEKHRKLAYLFRDDDRIVGIFGSYAKGMEKEGSDIDVFIIGSKKGPNYEKEGKRLDLNISVKYFQEKIIKNNLFKEIIGNHILINNAERFIKLIWRSFYDLD